MINFDRISFHNYRDCFSTFNLMMLNCFYYSISRDSTPWMYGWDLLSDELNSYAKTGKIMSAVRRREFALGFDWNAQSIAFKFPREDVNDPLVIDIPRGVLRIILSYVSYYQRTITRLGLVCSDWYTIILRACPVVSVSRENLFTIPQIVLRTTRCVHLKISPKLEKTRWGTVIYNDDKLMTVSTIKYILPHLKSNTALRELRISNRDPTMDNGFVLYRMLTHGVHRFVNLRVIKFYLISPALLVGGVRRTRVPLHQKFPFLEEVYYPGNISWCIGLTRLKELDITFPNMAFYKQDVISLSSIKISARWLFKYIVPRLKSIAIGNYHRFSIPDLKIAAPRLVRLIVRECHFNNYSMAFAPGPIPMIEEVEFKNVLIADQLAYLKPIWHRLKSVKLFVNELMDDRTPGHHISTCNKDVMAGISRACRMCFDETTILKDFTLSTLLSSRVVVRNHGRSIELYGRLWSRQTEYCNQNSVLVLTTVFGHGLRGLAYCNFRVILRSSAVIFFRNGNVMRWCERNGLVYAGCRKRMNRCVHVFHYASTDSI